ncbi:MAG: cytochrome d ubiquinol oxidase subunit II [Anaerolineales bacterium]|nr:cytochrome d ubiquinol oxidase subunit II [Anaerolineales bacterium]
MNLNALWFVLIGGLFIGFFLLEGFDYGVGILVPFLGKSDHERRMLINTIGPFWDANEVWLIAAGGAMFAAFPDWYATLFSGFYLAFLIILLCLIVRGVAFEFRSKETRPGWRRAWDGSLFIGSALPAFLWGVAMGNLILGVPIDADMNYVGGLFDLLQPYALAYGVTSFLGFVLTGAVFLTLRTTGDLAERAHQLAERLWLPTVIVVFLVVGYGYFYSGMFQRFGVNPAIVPLTAGAALLSAGFLLKRRFNGWAFGMLLVTIAFTLLTLLIGLYPRVMVSSLNPSWSLTIYNAASGQYTLRVMTIAAAIFLPFVLAYQAWSYWVFRQRVTPESHLEY